MRYRFIYTIISILGLVHTAAAQRVDSAYISNHYDLKTYNLPMRDGATLYTVVYTPKDHSKKHPFLINRTCYNASVYEHYNMYGHPSDYLVRDGFILVFQDVRGRYMSDGVFNNMTPNIPGNNPKNKKDIDESSDTWDTIDWLLKNIPNNNGKAGIYGISYPGFYSAASLPDAHPALKAVSPQAPVSDFFFDDFHHNGAYLESYTTAFPVFGIQKPGKTKADWFIPQMMAFYNGAHPDAYEFYLQQGPLKNITEKYYRDNFFWQQVIDHPNYDSFWQKRSILPHLKNIKPAVMVVGGWFDAEDLSGPLNIYKTIEKTTPGAYNTIVMGPWGHGDWASEKGRSKHNDIYFGDSISTFYQRNIELPFFRRFLKEDAATALPEAYMFNTGTKQWEQRAQWPPVDAPAIHFYFDAGGQLSTQKKIYDTSFVFSYISDPAKPVPYRSRTEGLDFTPRAYMSDDQREASTRPDVLTFETNVLDQDLTLAGEIVAKLVVSVTGTDADFIVKLVDVYPDNMPRDTSNAKDVVMGGYQQLVRSEIMRGRYRNSFEKPAPFVPGKKEKVNIRLQDVLHTFKKGHRVMVQVQSSWFPLFDRNPQKYVDNIYKADEKDFIKATINIYPESEISVNGKQ